MTKQHIGVFAKSSNFHLQFTFASSRGGCMNVVPERSKINWIVPMQTTGFDAVMPGTNLGVTLEQMTKMPRRRQRFILVMNRRFEEPGRKHSTKKSTKRRKRSDPSDGRRVGKGPEYLIQTIVPTPKEPVFGSKNHGKATKQEKQDQAKSLQAGAKKRHWRPTRRQVAEPSRWILKHARIGLSINMWFASLAVHVTRSTMRSHPMLTMTAIIVWLVIASDGLRSTRSCRTAMKSGDFLCLKGLEHPFVERIIFCDATTSRVRPFAWCVMAMYRGEKTARRGGINTSLRAVCRTATSGDVHKNYTVNLSVTRMSTPVQGLDQALLGWT